MRVPESWVEFNGPLLARDIEYEIAVSLDEWDRERDLDIVLPIEGLGKHSAEFRLLATRNFVEITVWMYLSDLLSLTGPRMSPAPHKTELGDHGTKYGEYRDRVIWTATSELGLRPEYTERDAIYADQEVYKIDGREDTAGLICGDYDGAHDMFGPSLSKRAPFSVGFKTEAFWELDELSGGVEGISSA